MTNSKVGDQKAPFSIATTPRCKGGRYSFPWIAPLYLISLSGKLGGIKYHLPTPPLGQDMTQGQFLSGV